MKNIKKLFALLVITFIISCNQSSDTGYFTLKGEIINNKSKKIYLEKMVAATMQPVLIDSVEVNKDGKFTLKGKAEESTVFNLRLDDNMYPVASVINDAREIELSIYLNKENNQFAEKYEVKGSKATNALKEFVLKFNKDVQQLFVYAQQADSLQKMAMPDTVLMPIMSSSNKLANNIRSWTSNEITKTENPALILFELGYYQSTANSGIGLEPFDNEEVMYFVNGGVKKFPKHQSLATIKNSLVKQLEQEKGKSLVGKPAPNFEMPDASGKMVSLKSFKGKYVLVDFWASWCGPCRKENPTVVAAWNKYKNNNLAIVGVSLDQPDGKDAWLKAVKEDKLTWVQLSDLKAWDSPVVGQYKFDGIPFNVLIDTAGIIIAQSLRGEALGKKLQEIFPQ